MRALDTETHLIRAGLQFPPLVCLTTDRGELFTRRELTSLSAYEPPYLFHNAPFDLGVLVEAGILTIADVFDLLDKGLVHDTLIREKLLDIATGQKFYRDASGKSIKRKYDLGALSAKYGQSVDKEDPWRLRYSELDGVPKEQWPAEAKHYAIKDAVVLPPIFAGQEERRARVARELGGDPLADEARQIRRAWALHLMRSWGIRTSGERVADLDKKARDALNELKENLATTGLVRADGTRDTKAAKARMLKVCAENGTDVTITATGEKKLKEGWTKEQCIAAGYIGLDADACKRSGDDALQDYCEINSYQLILSRDVRRFKDGVTHPIHTRINSLLDTGRASSSDPNLFNVRNFPGIRECFVPRDGTYFLNSDVSGLELATLAQVLKKLLGWSTMADAIVSHGSAGVLHTMFAARLLGITFEEAQRREALGKKADPEFYEARQTAKVANFGFPGGLGVTSLVYFARAKYKVILTESRAKELKREWLEMWPEMREYFASISDLCEAGGGKCTIRQLFSNRYRGDCFYTQACNGYFQALGADATGHALYELARACYVEGVNADLYGCRIVNYVYDEVILEVPYHLADRASKALTVLFEREANYFLPDVPIKMDTPKLMLYWSKDAKTVKNERGELVPWLN